jgi:hypothetical protein
VYGIIADCVGIWLPILAISPPFSVRPLIR